MNKNSDGFWFEVLFVIVVMIILYILGALLAPLGAIFQ